MKEKPFNSITWLWWLALFILALGAAFAALMYYTAPGPHVISDDIRRVMMFAIVGSGLCVISATAHWWTHR